MREIVICEDVEIERNLLNTVLRSIFMRLMKRSESLNMNQEKHLWQM